MGGSESLRHATEGRTIQKAFNNKETIAMEGCIKYEGAGALHLYADAGNWTGRDVVEKSSAEVPAGGMSFMLPQKNVRMEGHLFRGGGPLCRRGDEIGSKVNTRAPWRR